MIREFPTPLPYVINNIQTCSRRSDVGNVLHSTPAGYDGGRLGCGATEGVTNAKYEHGYIQNKEKQAIESTHSRTEEYAEYFR